ncbi:hypothetical protein QBC39DRAFT_44696 [Podospora conica]|nr:hypothetical protein QBC39DRAFT_44696 [Schizothecium conicum]
MRYNVPSSLVISQLPSALAWLTTHPSTNHERSLGRDVLRISCPDFSSLHTDQAAQIPQKSGWARMVAAGREEAKSPLFLFGLQTDPVRARTNQRAGWTRPRHVHVVVMHSSTSDVALSVAFDVVERWGSLDRQRIGFGTSLVTSPGGLPTRTGRARCRDSRVETGRSWARESGGRRGSIGSVPSRRRSPSTLFRNSAENPGIGDGVSRWQQDGSMAGWAPQ